MTPNELAALRAYAEQNRARCPLTANELAEARKSLSKAGLVRNCTGGRNRLFVELTPRGRELWERLQREATMTPEVADWIAANALTPRLIKGAGGIELIRMCQCQYGPCGHCKSLGRHDNCTTRVGRAGNPPASPLAWLRGFPVWSSGKPCRWRCSCDCPAPEPPPALAAAAPAVEQLGLFDLAGAS